jgi:glutathione synthase/RimK-type ligase-like ATP-grasp enzyme
MKLSNSEAVRLYKWIDSSAYTDYRIMSYFVENCFQTCQEVLVDRYYKRKLTNPIIIGFNKNCYEKFEAGTIEQIVDNMKNGMKILNEYLGIAESFEIEICKMKTTEGYDVEYCEIKLADYWYSNILRYQIFWKYIRICSVKYFTNMEEFFEFIKTRSTTGISFIDYLYYNNREELEYLLKNYKYIDFDVFKERINGNQSEMYNHFKEIQQTIVKNKKIEKNKLAQQAYRYKTERPIKVFSRHPSHEPLRLLHVNVRTLIRLGSTTPTPELKNKDFKYLEINIPDAVQNSASKIRMKECFSDANVKTAPFIVTCAETTTAQDIKNFVAQFKEGSKFVTKSEFGSRGQGNKIWNYDQIEEMIAWLSQNNRMGRYIIEKYMNYTKEYRLHISENGCFYTCRKMLKTDTAEADRWFRNDSNSVWVLESNELFDRPTTWKTIEAESVKALKAVGLDVGAVDVRVNSKGEFVIIEINSAPSFGDMTLEKYYEEIPRIIEFKLNKLTSL